MYLRHCGAVETADTIGGNYIPALLDEVCIYHAVLNVCVKRRVKCVNTSKKRCLWVRFLLGEMKYSLFYFFTRVTRQTLSCATRINA